jgi:hypothetical protein
MSFEISWHTPKKIIFVHLLGELDLNAVEAMAQQCAVLMDEGIAPVHILLDDRNGGRPPISLSQLRSRLEIGKHPYLGWIVGIGETDPVAKFLLPLVMNLISVKYERVATIDDALNFLIKQDLTIER